MQADLDEHLQGWKAWLPGFKALANLLGHRHLVKRLVAKCITGTAHAAVASCFETVVGSVAKWRWGTIVKVLPSILRLLRPLSLVWDARKFLDQSGEAENAADANVQGDSDNEPLDVHNVTAAIRSPSWKAYGHMLAHLHEIGNFISAWGSGCPCHEFLLTSSGSDTEGRAQSHFAEMLRATLRSLSLPKEADGAPRACALAGKRAPELATGAWKVRLQELIDELRPQVLMDTCELAAEDRERVLGDFEHGVSYIQLVLNIKLAHWSELPWQLCALATDARSERPKFAKTILEQFSKLPQHEEAHHRLTWRFLAPDSDLLRQLQALRDDPSVQLKDLPELFYEAWCGCKKMGLQLRHVLGAFTHQSRRLVLGVLEGVSPAIHSRGGANC